MVVFTAVNKHSPQQTWPQGTIVAKTGGEKHIGQVNRLSGTDGNAGELVGEISISEDDMSMSLDCKRVTC